MAQERRPISRAESQQRTREDVLDAAEQLFLAHGLHATTVANIAAAAGRTQGAIYGHFASKENLCAEVLLRRGMQIATEIWTAVSRSDRTLDDTLHPALESWRIVAQDDSLVALLVEYTLAVYKDPAQRAVSLGHLRMGRSLFDAMLADALPTGVTPSERESAVDGIASAAVGLALAQILGGVDEQNATALLHRTVRIWIDDVQRHIAGPGVDTDATLHGKL